MNESKRVIVEFGARRQQLILKDRSISILKLKNLMSKCFDLTSELLSNYSIQMYDYSLNEYRSIENKKDFLDLNKDIQHLHRFRLGKNEKTSLINNLQETVHQLQHAIKHIDQIQNLVGVLNYDCDILNHIFDDPHSNSSTCSYLLDPSSTEKILDPPVNDDDDDEHFDSVSSIDHPPVPSIVPRNESLKQTRLIPCKYAVRGTCHLGEKCLYLHDEICIQSEREWQRRL